MGMGDFYRPIPLNLTTPHYFDWIPVETCSDYSAAFVLSAGIGQNRSI